MERKRKEKIFSGGKTHSFISENLLKSSHTKVDHSCPHCQDRRAEHQHSRELPAAALLGTDGVGMTGHELRRPLM